MRLLLDHEIGARRVVVVATDRSDGDVHPLRVPNDELAARQRRLTGHRWSMLDQRHGAEVEVVRPPIDECAVVGVGDVLVTDAVDLPVALWAADCATLVLAAADGRLVGVHAGWRGLAAGVLDVAVDALEGRAVAAVASGPVIRPCCYPFGEADISRVAAAVRTDPARITSSTARGRPALDVPAALDAVLDRRGVAVAQHGPCTRCDASWYSHRRGDAGRHALVAWTERRS